MEFTIDSSKIFGQIKQPKVWATVLMAVVLIAGIVWWWTAREKRNRDALTSRDVLIEQLNNKWLACVNAPTDTVWIERVVDYGPTALIHPKPIKVMGPPVKEPPLPTDTSEADPCPRNYYNDTLYYDKYTINFEALGCLRNYRILKVKVTDKFPEITRHDLIIQHDTAYIPTVKKWQWGVEGQVFVNDFKSMPGLGGGVFVIFQDKLQLGGGLAYFNDFGGYLRLGYIIK